MKYYWINPEGELIEVGKYGHNNYAHDLLEKEMDKHDISDYLEDNGCDYAYQILHIRGWVRVSEQHSGKIKIAGDCISYVEIMRNTMHPTMNPKQLKVAKKLCKEFNTDFIDAVNI